MGIKITWLSTEMEEYTSGMAQHNRLFVDYLLNHPDIEKVTVVRLPTAVNGILPITKTTDNNGIEIYTPPLNIELKEAINSFKKGNLSQKARMQFALLRLGFKLTRFSTYNSKNIKKVGTMKLFAFAILTFQLPYPNPFFKQVAECIRKTHPDIIHSEAEQLATAGALARDMAKGHLSSQMQLEGAAIEGEKGSINAEFSSRFTKSLEWARESGNVDLFLPVSEVVGDYLKKCGVEKNNQKIIPSPMAIKHFSKIDKEKAREKLNLPKDKKIILSLGRFVPRKRYQDVLKILPDLPKDVIYYIKESKSLSEKFFSTKKDILKIIKKNGLNNRVIIDDSSYSYDTMKYVYSACDVGVFPYLNEPFGMCATEAMASYLPIIIYNSGYFPYFINNNGFLVEPQDYDDLLAKINIILNDSNLANEMGEKGREISKKYDINVVGEKLVNLYKEFL